MSLHNHQYANVYNVYNPAGEYYLEDNIRKVNALCGVTSSKCPSGHSSCKATGGVLKQWAAAGIVEGMLITSMADDAEIHTHSYKKVDVSSSLAGLTRAGKSVIPTSVCDVSPQWCLFGYDLWDKFALEAEIVDAETGTGGGGSHTHFVQAVQIMKLFDIYAAVTGKTICSLGHASCRAICTEYQDYYAIKDDFYPLGTSGPGEFGAFVVQTLPPGWTAELETKTPVAYIDKTWALIRGELLSLEGIQYPNCVYLGFDYWKIPSVLHTQWYNPPGGATKIYLPQPFSANIGGLQPGSTYHYRAKAQLDSNIDVALLNGHVTLDAEYQGLETECYFEWGETDAYGEETDPVTKFYSGNFASVLTEWLDPEVTYHYRAVARNEFDTLYGEDIEFSVLGAYYGEEESFQTLTTPSPVFGAGSGYDYVTTKQALEHVAKLAVGRGYGDKEGQFNYESRNVR